MGSLRMSKSSVAENVEKIIKPIVESLGYELVEVDYSKQHFGMALTITIFSKNGITIEDCEKVSNAIDAPIDELNPTNDEPYTLNVSSPGLDRPIKTSDDARRNLGVDIDIKLFTPKNGKKLWSGKIVDYCDESLTIEDESGKHTFTFSEIALAKQKIEF